MDGDADLRVTSTTRIEETIHHTLLHHAQQLANSVLLHALVHGHRVDQYRGVDLHQLGRVNTI